MFAHKNQINLKCVHLLVYSVFACLNITLCNIHLTVTHPKVSIEYFYEKEISLDTHKYLEIKNATRLQLRCISNQPIRWLFNRRELDYVANFEINLISENDTVRNKFIVDLILRSAEYNQTGEYSCIRKDEKSLIDEYNGPSDRVYLFVYDNEHLVATKTLVEVPSKSEEYILRCLPTNPRVNVTLTKDSELMIIDNDTLKFHPTIGFIIKDSILDYKKSNLFNCVFSYENKTDELPFPFTISYVPLDNLSIRIDGDSENVIVNSSITLSCELITQKVGKMKLGWEYPNSNLIEPIKQSSFDYINDQMKYINTITFTNVTKNNEGEYSCSASNSTMKNTKSINLKVFELNTTFTINITTDLGSDAEIEIDYGIDVLMAYTINVWPTKGNFKLSCLRNGIVLSSSVMKNQLVEMETIPDQIDDSRYSFVFENNQLIVSIKDADVFDSGIYTVSGQNSNSFANESITLIINGLPYIKMNYNEKFFELNKIYNLNFDIISFPLTNITFERYLCTETECDPSKKTNDWIELFDQTFYQQFNLSSSVEQNYTIQMNDHNVTVKSFEKPKYFQIQLDLLANQSSIFKCEVSNNFGTTITSLPALVSDAGSEGLDLIVSNTELIEDDNIILICKATKFNYTKIYWTWSLYDEEISKPILFDKLIETNETVHSLQSQLTILNAKQNASGEYKCNANYKEEQDTTYEPNIKHVQLIIKQMVPPKILKSNMANDHSPLKIIEVYQTTSIDLYCEVYGRPKPTIVWRKNNVALNSTNGIELTQNRQHLSIKRLVLDDSGRYECEVENQGGFQKRVIGLKVKNKNDDAIPFAGLAGIFTFMLIGCVFVVMAVFLGKRIREDRKQKQELEMFTQKLFNINQNIPFNPDLPLDEQIDLLPYDSKMEFPIDKLTFGPVLGQGAFGRVIKAEAEGIEEFNYKTTVAVKMLKEDADMEQRKALMAELKILIHLGKHLNIVNLMGAVTTNAIKGELLVILEYCEHGSLRQFLLNNRRNFINQLDLDTGEIDTNILEKQDYNYANEEVINSMQKDSCSTVIESDLKEFEQDSNDMYLELTTGAQNRAVMKRKKDTIEPITSTDLVCFAFQISRGMEYLQSRKLIHRDLAIRNVLLAGDNIVKICDFGLAKDCFQYDNYVKKNNGPLPIKWMAVESIADKIFTIKSDVWSFAIVLWEIFTLGSNPYPGIEVDEEFYRKLKNGYRMEQPSYCPDGIYELMQLCWLEDPNERLDFSEITKRLGRYLGENVLTHYIDLSLPYEQTNLVENEGYLQIDSNFGNQTEEYLNEDYLNDIVLDEIDNDTKNNYVNQQINDYLNDDQIKQEKVTIIDFNRNDSINHHTYTNINL